MLRYTKYVELVEHTGAPDFQMFYKKFTEQVQIYTQNKSPADSSLMSQLSAL